MDNLAQVVRDYLGTVARQGNLITSGIGKSAVPKSTVRSASTEGLDRTGVAVQVVSEASTGDNNKITVSCLGANLGVGDREVLSAQRLLRGFNAVRLVMLQLEVNMWATRQVAAAASIARAAK